MWKVLVVGMRDGPVELTYDCEALAYEASQFYLERWPYLSVTYWKD